jgi:nucleoside 2-deoxyribosyltransferase
MIYPEKIVSSVLFEAGIAFALGKPSFYFGHKDNFPFLMQEANQQFNHVKIHEADTIDKIIKIIKKNKTELFKIDKAEL